MVLPTRSRLGAGTQPHFCLISRSGVYVSVTLLWQLRASCRKRNDLQLVETQSRMGRHHLISHKACQHKNNFSETLAHVWTSRVSQYWISTLLQHLRPSLQRPKCVFAWISCTFKPMPKLTSFQFCHLLTALCAKSSNNPPGWKNTSVYTSGQWLICGTYNGWGSASEIIQVRSGWNWGGQLHYPLRTQAVFFRKWTEAEGGKLKAHGSLKKWNSLLLICKMILQVLGFSLILRVLAVATQPDSSDTFCSLCLNDNNNKKGKTWKLSVSVSEFILQNKIFSPGTCWVLCRFNFSGWRKCCKNNSESQNKIT